MTQENPEVMEAEAADEQAENPDFVPVEEAPAEEPTPAGEKPVIEIVTSPPVLFPDVYAAASQAFADSRANIAAKEKALEDNTLAMEAVSVEEAAVEATYQRDMAALDRKRQEIGAQRTVIAESLVAAMASDKEAAKALIAVLQSYVA